MKNDEALLAALQLIGERGPDIGAHWRHGKTGGVYVVVANAVREADVVPVVVYRESPPVGVGFRHGVATPWVRPLTEFTDGRFTMLAPAPSPAPNPAHEATAAAFRAHQRATADGAPEGTREALDQCARMLDAYAPDVYPANERGQVHFARAMMESVADEIRAFLAAGSPAAPPAADETDPYPLRPGDRVEVAERAAASDSTLYTAAIYGADGRGLVRGPASLTRERAELLARQMLFEARAKAEAEGKDCP